MVDEQYCVGFYEVVQEVYVFLGEEGIVYSQCFIDYEDVGIDVGDYGKGQVYIYVVGVGFDWLVYEIVDIGKCFDVFEVGFDLLVCKFQQLFVYEDIFVFVVFWIEIGFQLQ